jgi:MFS family permease
MEDDARRWIVASALIGFGQQLYVVLRNQLVHDLGLPIGLLGVVQGMGAATGVAAGVAGLWLLPRFPAAWALRVGALANAAGFAMQVVATRGWHFVLGAALAGVGIQMLTMASGPFLARRVTERDRVRTYASQMIAIQTAPGLLGAVLGGELQHVVSAAYASAVGGYRVALAAGAASVALALVPLQGLAREDGARRDARPLRIADLRRFSVFLAPDAVLHFGAGLAVPFLQVHLRVTYGALPHHVGWYFGAMMLAGTLGNLAAPLVARRLGNVRSLAILQVGAAIGFVGLAMAATVGGAVVALVARYACSVTAIPLWTAALHAALPPPEAERAASWRMVVQSVAWAAANLLAGAALTRGAGALRVLFLAAAVSQVLAAWGCWRSLALLARRRESILTESGTGGS